MSKVFIRRVTPCLFFFLAISSTLCLAEKPIPKALEAESFDNFRAPDTVLRTGPEAEKYCKNLSDKTRLPTAIELYELFISKTKTPPGLEANEDMCTVHGWPLNHLCGGTKGFYLAQEESKYYVVGLTTGLIIWTNPEYTALVACAIDK
ncbi:hypothetical protein [Pseudomonas fluorescens]|uniref:hypothetical protein n=1 Tax=Pseudomonas fluorescens TaxID=294 RepID=UPI0012408A7F|nr:hypothetical protein [Pseudomonas fluorescens]